METPRLFDRSGRSALVTGGPAGLGSSRTPQGKRVRVSLTLYRYFAIEMLVPALFSLGILTFVVLTKDVLGYTDLVINRGLGVGSVALIVFYQTLPLAAMTLPFAVMIGCLSALGHLGANHELLALEAIGVSAPALVAPVATAAAGMAIIGLFLSLFGAPWANRTLDAAFDQLARERPGARIRAGVVQHFGDWKLEAREASSRGDRMSGVLLWIPDLGETVFAKKGTLSPSDDASTQVILEQGTVLLDPRRQARALYFDKLSAQLPETEQAIARDERDRIGGIRLRELIALAGREQGTLALVELHRRFALPVATLLFGVLAVPISLFRRHFSRAGGVVVGISVTIAYYGLVQLGDGLIQGRTLGVAAGVWLPNLALGLAAPLLALPMRRMISYGRPSARRQGRRFERVWSARTHRGQQRETEAAPRVHRWAFQRYVAGRFLSMTLLSFVALLTAYLLVDVLERLQFFARYHASSAEILRYYSARLPVLASRVVPMSLLLATALGVGALAAQNELLALHSCGIPALRALLPLPALCALVVPGQFLLINSIVPRSYTLWHYVKNVEIRGRKLDVRERAAVWYRVANRHYEADLLDPQHGVAHNISVYELGEDGLPSSREDAREARHIGGGVWRLTDPVIVRVVDGRLTRAAGSPFAKLGAHASSEIDTSQLSIGALRSAIRDVESSGHDANPYRVDLFAKLAEPLACLVLPVLALVFALSGPPFPGTAIMLLFGCLVAASYVLLTGIGTSLGYGGVLPPPIAGSAPTALFVLAALGYGIRLRNRG